MRVEQHLQRQRAVQAERIAALRQVQRDALRRAVQALQVVAGARAVSHRDGEPPGAGIAERLPPLPRERVHRFAGVAQQHAQVVGLR
ncbi:MAG TPA: hypothetical protein DD456_03025, partial [Stenotrophomonas sp.]|nr:hypothetical protein [Stenotrophomonas sp.]